MKFFFTKGFFVFFLGFLFLLFCPFLWAKDSEIDALQKDVKDRSQRIEELEQEKSDSLAGKKKKSMETHWKDGVHFIYDKDGIKIQLGGRLDVDWLFITGSQPAKNAYGEFEPNGNGPLLRDGAEIRRGRIYIAGLLYELVKFKLQLEFSSGEAHFESAYLGLTNLPYLGTILVGHMKEPIGLENLTSSRFITFIERSLPRDAFTPDYNLGVMIQNHFAKRLTYALGVFRQTDSTGFGTGDNEYNVTGRLTGLPLYQDGGKILIHLGGAFSYRNPTFDNLRFRTRPEAHLGPFVLDSRDPVTGADIQSDGVQFYGVEGALVLGPFSLQSEFMIAIFDTLPIIPAPPPPLFVPLAPFPWAGSFPDDTHYFHGWYVFVSYFLTGENRAYKTSSGVFSRVKPKQPFMIGKGGWGAWEVAGRISHLDLQDGPYNPFLGAGVGPFGLNRASFGNVTDYTLALNWYLNPNTRIMFNYILSDPDPNGMLHQFLTRFHVDF